MNHSEIKYALDFAVGLKVTGTSSSDKQQSNRKQAGDVVPRIARLMALAIRFDRLLRADEFKDYAELARLGRVTREPA